MNSTSVKLRTSVKLVKDYHEENEKISPQLGEGIDRT